MKNTLLAIAFFMLPIHSFAHEKDTSDCKKYIETTVDKSTGNATTATKSVHSLGGKTAGLEMYMSISKNRTTLTFLLNGVCINEHDEIIVSFKDGRMVSAFTTADSNCEGKFTLHFNPMFDIPALWDGLKSKKVDAIRFKLKSGVKDFSLTESESDYLLNVAKCIALEDKTVIVFEFVEQMPTPTFDLDNFISTNLHYPDTIGKENIQGRVVMKFVVMSDGSIGDIEIVRGIDKDFDAEARRIISIMPKWKPGKQNGKPVNVYRTLPIVFSAD